MHRALLTEFRARRPTPRAQSQDEGRQRTEHGHAHHAASLVTRQTVILEPGGISQVVDHLDPDDSVFLVADGTAWSTSGADAALDPVLRHHHVVRFDSFRPNPRIEDVRTGLTLYHNEPCDVVLAVGGGTAIDIAKMVAACATGADPLDIIESRAAVPESRPKLVAVPTTAGTGSEATHFAVVYVDGRKYSVAHPRMRPDVAIVDARLTASMPAPITAHTGLDATAQAMESIWSVHATSASSRFAEEALRLAWTHLPGAVRNPDSRSREAMARAAHLAGRAIDISKTTAPHALSYAITSRYAVPHGLAVALTLGAVLVHNSQAADHDVRHPGGVTGVRACIDRILEVLDVSSPPSAAQQLRHRLAEIGCPAGLRQAGVPIEDLPALADAVNVERLANNPRSLNRDDLIAILEASY